MDIFNKSEHIFLGLLALYGAYKMWLPGKKNRFLFETHYADGKPQIKIVANSLHEVEELLRIAAKYDATGEANDEKL